MRKGILVACSLAAFRLVAAEAQFEVPKPDGMDYFEYIFLCTEGGHYYVPKSGYGTVLFVNDQKIVPDAELQKITPLVQDENWVAMRFTAKKENAEIVIEVVDREKESALAVFPDDRRAVVNVRALMKDNPSPEVLASRTRKELIRAFSFVCGISGCNGQGHIMDVMSDMARLDAAKEEVPGELSMRNAKYLERSGVKPYLRETYKDACEQGHAPAPTNVWEKAVWKRVHERPTKPIKIQFKK